MKSNFKTALTTEYIIGILSLIVFFYRTIYIMFPMMYEGYAKNNVSLIMKSFTMLV